MSRVEKFMIAFCIFAFGMVLSALAGTTPANGAQFLLICIIYVEVTSRGKKNVP